MQISAAFTVISSVYAMIGRNSPSLGRTISNVGCNMSSRADTADRVIKYTIGTLIVLFFIAPVLSLMMSMTGMMATTGIVGNLNMTFTAPARGPGSIAGGANPQVIAALKDKMHKLTAYSGEAKGAAKIVQFVALHFDDDTLPEAGDVFRPVTLDFTAAENTAVVAITNRPVRISVRPNKGSHRALLGVESPTPFDVEDLPKGMLAGFRIGAFDGKDAASPEQYIERRGVEQFCTAVMAWIKFYGVRRSAVRIAALRNPKTVEISPYGVNNNGDVVRGLPDLDVYCTSN